MTQSAVKNDMSNEQIVSDNPDMSLHNDNFILLFFSIFIFMRTILLNTEKIYSPPVFRFNMNSNVQLLSKLTSHSLRIKLLETSREPTSEFIFFNDS